MIVKHNQSHMSQTDQVAEATISDEELELELELDGTEDTENLREKLEKAETAKKQILARARKAEQELKDLKPAPITEEKPKPDDVDRDALIELRLDGYTTDEATFILKNGGASVLKDPTSYVSIAVNAKREQRRAEEEASKASNGSGVSGVERKYTEEQLANMPLKDLEKILPHADPS